MKLGFELLKQGDTSSYGWVERQNHENPYSEQELLNAVVDTANESKITNILSIPSPYARFHVTETAFLEAKRRQFNNLAPVYRRAISHCLDMFELFFEYDGVKLRDEHVEVKKHHYESLEDVKTDNFNLKVYVGSLELYRKNYGDGKFNNFYKIVRIVNGIEHLIGSTSPFTIFTTPEDISPECVFHLKDRTLFANHELDGDGKSLWSGIEGRNSKLQLFLYALVKKYNERFPAIWGYLEQWTNIAIKNQVNSIVEYFDKNYSNYLIKGDAGVPIKVDKKMDEQVEVLPLGYDTFVFLNFLDTGNAHDYSCVENSDSKLYDTPIESRKNNFKNSTNPSPLCWLTIHDLLEDDVFITRNHLNDVLYFANSEDNDEKFDAILPFKKKFFELFNMYDEYGKLKDRAVLKKWVSERFVTLKEGDAINGFTEKRKLYVTLSLPIKDSEDRVELTKIYEPEHIHELNIDFGIYPFQQVTKGYRNENEPDNFYRIMLYLTGNRVKNLSKDIKLYAKDDSSNLLIDEDISQNTANQYHVQRHSTITEENFQGLIKDNLYYISLESRYFIKNQPSAYRDVRFNFVEITIDGKRILLIPRLEPRNLEAPNNNAIAVDLGTSNTYVAYGMGKDTHAFEEQYDILVGKLCYNDEHKYDIVQGGLHQCTEFIPTEFGTEEWKGSFPIQSIQLFQKSVISDRSLDHDVVAPDGAPYVSMFTMNVPFLFDRKGSRSIGTTIVDSKITNFKWFSTANEEHMEQNAFNLFVDQLCFMLRNKFISMNEDLKDVKLAWTYPLTIAGSGMIEVFKTVWENAYKKYFNENVGGNLCHFTESETPIEKSKYAHDQYGMKIGIDIGGGTSDVLIYETANQGGDTTNVPLLATSFSFAGNVMFGKINGDSAVMLNSENVWFNVLKKQVSETGTISGNGVTANIVDIDPNKHNITDFMDFIFTHILNNREAEIRLAMSNPALKFISLMHISALIWEVAKVCKVKLKDMYPDLIALSGNGSKLILMSEKNCDEKDRIIKKLFEGIFQTIYKKDFPDIKIDIYKEPKKATAEGALSLLALRKTKDRVNVAKVNYSLYRERLYLLSEDDLSDVSGGSGDSSNLNNVATSDSSSEDPFGGMLDTVPVQEPTPKETEPVPEISNGVCPETNCISRDWKEIAAEVGLFLDFYFRLAGAPLGGKISTSGISTIKTNIFGSDSRYDTEKMQTLIERAKKTIEIRAQVMSNGLSPDLKIKDSVFLAVMAQIIAEIIKYFGKSLK